MQGEQVVLTDMLQCRKRRAQIQDTFKSRIHSLNNTTVRSFHSV